MSSNRINCTELVNIISHLWAYNDNEDVDDVDEETIVSRD